MRGGLAWLDRRMPAALRQDLPRLRGRAAHRRARRHRVAGKGEAGVRARRGVLQQLPRSHGQRLLDHADGHRRSSVPRQSLRRPMERLPGSAEEARRQLRELVSLVHALDRPRGRRFAVLLICISLLSDRVASQSAPAPSLTLGVQPPAGMRVGAFTVDRDRNVYFVGTTTDLPFQPHRARTAAAAVLMASADSVSSAGRSPTSSSSRWAAMVNGSCRRSSAATGNCRRD